MKKQSKNIAVTLCGSIIANVLVFECFMYDF